MNKFAVDSNRITVLKNICHTEKQMIASQTASPAAYFDVQYIEKAHYDEPLCSF